MTRRAHYAAGKPDLLDTPGRSMADVEEVTVIRGRAGFKGEAVLTLDRQGMRLTHPRRSLQFDVTWPDVHEAKVISVVKQGAPNGPGPRQQIASFRLKQSEQPAGFRARLKRLLSSEDVLVAGVFDQSPQELVEMMERYRRRHGVPG